LRALRFVFFVLSAAAIPFGFAPELGCRPDSFDGIVGGPGDAGDAQTPTELRPDENLPAPRPVAPLSVSWVNGSRVRFEWELAQGTTGARIELCRTRACDGEKKTFDADGIELLTPEELPTGFWFWRLYGKTADAIGTKPSATWELLVRGGPLTSGRGTGSITDVNGDGAPDLVVTMEVEPILDDAGTFTPYDLVVLFGSKEDPTRFTMPDVTSPLYLPATHGTDVAVTDVDGDGFSDLTWALEARGHFDVLAFAGSADFLRPSLTTVVTPPLLDPPNLREAGDVDLDGRGDVVISTRRDIFTLLGTAGGPGPMTYVFQLGLIDTEGGVPDLPSAMALGAGHDYDGDGVPESPFAWPLGDTPVAYLLAGVPAVMAAAPVFLSGPPKGEATAFAGGDFSGRGLTDTAFATTVEGAPAVCILRGLDLEAEENPATCWSPPSPAPPGFASSMTAADLDEDGRDELVVGSTANGIWILRWADAGITAEHLDVPYGAKVTTIHPGRPGPAVWAATQASGADIAIFRGTTKSATIQPPEFTRGFGSTIR